MKLKFRILKVKKKEIPPFIHLFYLGDEILLIWHVYS